MALRGWLGRKIQQRVKEHKQFKRAYETHKSRFETQRRRERKIGMLRKAQSRARERVYLGDTIKDTIKGEAKRFLAGRIKAATKPRRRYHPRPRPRYAGYGGQPIIIVSGSGRTSYGAARPRKKRRPRNQLEVFGNMRI